MIASIEAPFPEEISKRVDPKVKEGKRKSNFSGSNYLNLSILSLFIPMGLIPIVQIIVSCFSNHFISVVSYFSNLSYHLSDEFQVNYWVDIQSLINSGNKPNILLLGGEYNAETSTLTVQDSEEAFLKINDVSWELPAGVYKMPEGTVFFQEYKVAINVDQVNEYFFDSYVDNHPSVEVKFYAHAEFSMEETSVRNGMVCFPEPVLHVSDQSTIDEALFLNEINIPPLDWDVQSSNVLFEGLNQMEKEYLIFSREGAMISFEERIAENHQAEFYSDTLFYVLEYKQSKDTWQWVPAVSHTANNGNQVYQYVLDYTPPASLSPSSQITLEPLANEGLQVSGEHEDLFESASKTQTNYIWDAQRYQYLLKVGDSSVCVDLEKKYMNYLDFEFSLSLEDSYEGTYVLANLFREYEDELGNQIYSKYATLSADESHVYFNIGEDYLTWSLEEGSLLSSEGSEFYRIQLQIIDGEVSLDVFDNSTKLLGSLSGDLKTEGVEVPGENLYMILGDNHFLGGAPDFYVSEFTLRNERGVQLETDFTLKNQRVTIENVEFGSGLFGGYPLGEMVSSFRFGSLDVSKIYLTETHLFDYSLYDYDLSVYLLRERDSFRIEYRDFDNQVFASTDLSEEELSQLKGVSLSFYVANMSTTSEGNYSLTLYPRFQEFYSETFVADGTAGSYQFMRPIEIDNIPSYLFNKLENRWTIPELRISNLHSSILFPDQLIAGDWVYSNFTSQYEASFIEPQTINAPIEPFSFMESREIVLSSGDKIYEWGAFHGRTDQGSLLMEVDPIQSDNLFLLEWVFQSEGRENIYKLSFERSDESVICQLENQTSGEVLRVKNDQGEVLEIDLSQSHDLYLSWNEEEVFFIVDHQEFYLYNENGQRITSQDFLFSTNNSPIDVYVRVPFNQEEISPLRKIESYSSCIDGEWIQQVVAVDSAISPEVQYMSMDSLLSFSSSSLEWINLDGRLTFPSQFFIGGEVVFEESENVGNLYLTPQSYFSFSREFDVYHDLGDAHIELPLSEVQWVREEYSTLKDVSRVSSVVNKEKLSMRRILFLALNGTAFIEMTFFVLCILGMFYLSKKRSSIKKTVLFLSSFFLFSFVGLFIILFLLSSLYSPLQLVDSLLNSTLNVVVVGVPMFILLFSQFIFVLGSFLLLNFYKKKKKEKSISKKDKHYVSDYLVPIKSSHQNYSNKTSRIPMKTQLDKMKIPADSSTSGLEIDKESYYENLLAGTIYDISSSEGAIDKVPPSERAIYDVPSSEGAIDKVPPSKGAIDKVPPSKGGIYELPLESSYDSPLEVQEQRGLSTVFYPVPINNYENVKKSESEASEEEGEMRKKVYFSEIVRKMDESEEISIDPYLKVETILEIQNFSEIVSKVIGWVEKIYRIDLFIACDILEKDQVSVSLIQSSQINENYNNLKVNLFPYFSSKKFKENYSLEEKKMLLLFNLFYQSICFIAENHNIEFQEKMGEEYTYILVVFSMIKSMKIMDFQLDIQSLISRYICESLNCEIQQETGVQLTHETSQSLFQLYQDLKEHEEVLTTPLDLWDFIQSNSRMVERYYDFRKVLEKLYASV